MNDVQKTAVSVSEMARMVGLSRARFYELMNEGVFPSPVYDLETRRPFYSDEMQENCLEVKRRNCGVNGKPILFYASRHPLGSQPIKRPARPKTKPKRTSQYNELIDSLSSLGLSASAQQVEAAVNECFPEGIQNLDSGEVVRAVFLNLKCQQL
ncbi:AlpA family phage regulatory protein [Gimesia chilikensis]|uniref:helix-turn-helix transcriptional regulator n=1 Tax=Gimesia chilikensis TaxID=2605989 RepID=UPI0011F022A5|nr:AlpA family phage regulatory protein [Gimesia chilikensis]KAA0131588.1 AlpA family phage regulatory protein [Gimesia chilikensis]